MKDRIIFGATSAMATGIARVWATRGDRLTLVGRNADKMAALAKDLQARGASQVDVVVMDFNETKSLWTEVQDLVEEHERVDTLLVAQGGLGANPSEEISPDKATETWNLNFQSAAIVVLAAKNHFVKNNYGTIAAFSAPEAELGQSHNYLYAASKSALKTLLAGLRQELKSKGVHVCTITAAKVDTPFHGGASVEDRSGKLWNRVEAVALKMAADIDKTPVLYVPFYWRFLLFFRKLLPESVAQKIRL